MALPWPPAQRGPGSRWRSVRGDVASASQRLHPIWHCQRFAHAQRLLAVVAVACFALLAAPASESGLSWVGAALPSSRRHLQSVAPRSPVTLQVAEESEAAGREKPWWEAEAGKVRSRLENVDTTDAIEKLRRQLTTEEQAFDMEIEEVVLSGKRALLKLRMQKAVEMPGMKTHLFKRIRRQIARALTLRREREIARGITREQSRRMRRRRRLELKMQYEDAYGREHNMPKSRKWLRRMGRIV
eukprot:TRINITY_DN91295_c0_g1_i1.p1 TRINITY_DN91295_c0_g1~~TRINITY_DN91295_c0_g1_i1.p1  ORF type:complete len:243 (-),score=63.11 TRINITY_DN91295_c0_g1_i1:103-831(-)